MKNRSGRAFRTGIVSVLFLALSVAPALGASAARPGNSAEGISIEKLIERHARKDAKVGKFYACRMADNCDHARWHQRHASQNRPI
ncbi:MAG: hypothetical protein ACFCU2_08035 [Acidimicrobiia bacterium]